MPTYEYACKSCGEHLEVVQSFTEEPLTTCPRCGGDLRKVFGAVGIVFKGSGFYKTDSRSTSTASNPAKRETADAAASSSGSETKAPAGSEAPASTPAGAGAGASSPSPAGGGSAPSTTPSAVA